MIEHHALSPAVPAAVARPARSWVDIHSRARQQRARLMRILFRRGWRHLRRLVRGAVPTPSSRPAYEYWP